MNGVSPRASATPPSPWASWAKLAATTKANVNRAESAGPAIIVHTADHALAALAAAQSLGVEDVTLASAPGAAAYAGPQWFLEIVASAARDHGGVTVRGVLDCGDRPGTALAALRLGAKAISFKGKAAPKLAAIARQSGARLYSGVGRRSLDLLNAADAHAACLDWFAATGRASQ